MLDLPELDLPELDLPGLEPDCDAGARWMCEVCGFVYDQACGLPEEGIAAGIHWDDVPADWVCPDCGMGKADFSMQPLD